MAAKFNAPTKCVKCGGPMEAGIYVTNSDDSDVESGMYANELESTDLWWRLEQKEEKALLSSKKTTELVLAKPAGGPVMVLHYRCGDCGFIESYAPPSA